MSTLAPPKRTHTVQAEGQTIENVAEHFDRHAPDYDAGCQRVEWKGPQELINRVRLIVPGHLENAVSILDYGTGTGPVGEALKKLNETVKITGADISGEMLKIARSKGNIDEGLHGDLSVLHSIPDESFDAVLSAGVFDFIDNSGALIDEFVRITKPGGIIAYTYEPTSTKEQGTHGFKSLRHNPSVLKEQFRNHANRSAVVLDEHEVPGIFKANFLKTPRDVHHNIFIGALGQ